MVTVVNLKYHPYTVYCGRPGKGLKGPFGNKFIVGVHGPRGECVKLFEKWFFSEEKDAVAYRMNVETHIPQDAVLGCFCKPLPCHCDIIADYLNRSEIEC